MRITAYIMGCLCLYGQAQTAVYNTGNFRVHPAGQLGLHTHLINNGSFDENEGMVGLYGNDPLSISGAFWPQFTDLEIFTEERIAVESGIRVSGIANFALGEIHTPRNQWDTHILFEGASATHVGTSSISMVSGFVAMTQKQHFTFPVGHKGRLQPLILDASSPYPLAHCAFYHESPQFPSHLSGSYPFAQRNTTTVRAISSKAYWVLTGSAPLTISVSWDTDSELNKLASNLNQIGLVGWHKEERQWTLIGAVNPVGSIDQGFITSPPFTPDHYSHITLGRMAETPSSQENQKLNNYLLTPNGDGINDVLSLDELKGKSLNTLFIFDRNGIKVFEQRNYSNEFNGNSNTSALSLSGNGKLPQGVYFYLLRIQGENRELSGFLYLDRD